MTLLATLVAAATTAAEPAAVAPAKVHCGLTGQVATSDIHVTDPHQRIVFDVPAGPAVCRLNEFSSQSGAQMLFPYELVGSISTNSVTGTIELLTAVELMLQNTGLTYRYEIGQSITVTISLLKKEEGRTPFFFEADGRSYRCVPLHFMLGFGFMLTKSQRTLWNIGVGLGEIPADQWYCTPGEYITDDDEAWRDIADNVTVRASKPRAPLIRWKQ